MIAECNYSFIFAAKNTIMSQTAVTIRIDSDIKNKFDELCNEFGMSVNTAFNIYARSVVRNKMIPFTIEALDDETMEKGRQAFYRMRQAAIDSGMTMSLEEINEEIRQARKHKNDDSICSD